MARKILDANPILRFILQDIEEQADMVEAYIDTHVVFVPYEVMAEVIYVMRKVYEIDRKMVAESLQLFTEIDNVQTEDRNITATAIQQFSETSLDFVDCVLYAYHAVRKDEIFTFDKKLNKRIRQLDKDE